MSCANSSSDPSHVKLPPAPGRPVELRLVPDHPIVDPTRVKLRRLGDELPPIVIGIVERRLKIARRRALALSPGSACRPVGRELEQPNKVHAPIELRLELPLRDGDAELVVVRPVRLDLIPGQNDPFPAARSGRPSPGVAKPFGHAKAGVEWRRGRRWRGQRHQYRQAQHHHNTRHGQALQRPEGPQVAGLVLLYALRMTRHVSSTWTPSALRIPPSAPSRPARTGPTADRCARRDDTE